MKTPLNLGLMMRVLPDFQIRLISYLKYFLAISLAFTSAITTAAFAADKPKLVLQVTVLVTECVVA